MIRTIRPYHDMGMWVFDDPSVDLEREPFVGGMDDIIDAFLRDKKIQNPSKGFRLQFSDQPFPEAEQLTWVRTEMGGDTYAWNDMEGWLCPALKLYFPTAPPRLFVRITA